MAILQLGKPLQFASVDDVDLDKSRTMNRSTWDELVSCGWLQLNQNAFILGPSGSGKTYVASALSNKAMRDGYSVLYTSRLRLLEALADLRTIATRRALLFQISRNDLLVIDDFTPACLAQDHGQSLLAIFEERHSRSSTLLTTGIPLHCWYHSCGSPQLAHRIAELLPPAFCLELHSKPCLHRQ